MNPRNNDLIVGDDCEKRENLLSEYGGGSVSTDNGFSVNGDKTPIFTYIKNAVFAFSRYFKNIILIINDFT